MCKEKVFISQGLLIDFKRHLILTERSPATVEKYCRDVTAFFEYIKNDEVTKEALIGYKSTLIDSGYATNSINSMIASINTLLDFIERSDLKIKSIKVQKKVFCSEEKELTKPEYERLVKTARKRNNTRLFLILQTICGTGIRISEMRFITVEAAKRGEAVVSCKGKTRSVFLVRALQKALLNYARMKGIESGIIFVTRSGKPVDRTNVWRDMKGLCVDADVDPKKVFPHNLRHLFARIFYGLEKDIAKLADILGHSSINTTRIYIVSTGAEHRRYMENMKLII